MRASQRGRLCRVNLILYDSFMSNINESRQAETRATSEKPTECNDPNQPRSMEQIFTSGQTYEKGSFRRDRRIDSGFFADERSLNEAILKQLLESTNKELDNARTRIDWYTQKEKEYLEQVQQLECLIELARKSQEQKQAFEEE